MQLYDPAIAFLRLYLREMNFMFLVLKYIYMNVYSSFIHNSSKLVKTYISFSGLMFKQTVGIHAMDYYYSAIKWNELLIHKATWINLQGIILSEK